MNGIFGMARLDGAPVARADLDAMAGAMAGWGRGGCAFWLSGPVGMGHARSCRRGDAQGEHRPRLDEPGGFVFTAAARVDNRTELGAALSIPTAERPGVPDSEFLLHAYRRWGRECPSRIHGDWACAAWHPAERRLFLARDHFGNTALYYYADANVFAFASSRRAVLALGVAPLALDELYLAQVLIGWSAYHGERTIHAAIRRLPPAHCLTVTPSRLDVSCYWRLQDTPELRLPHRADYVAAFREVFDEAVRVRVRDERPVAVMLSGGLDSGAVAATAARVLREEGRRLGAFVSVPLFDTAGWPWKSIGDEFPLAQATARHAGNVDLHPIAAAAVTPIEGIRRALHICGEPAHAACNYYWMLDLEDVASASGHRVLLTGQMGNPGASWTGKISSQSLACQLRHGGARAWARDRLRRVAPRALLAWRQRRARDRSGFSAIRPDFARRLHLWERQVEDPDQQPARTALDARLRVLMPGRSMVGAIHAEFAAASGLDVRDPTGDARLLAFTMSVPDRIFVDPDTGLDRWLMREAMTGRLPDQVRLNRRLGRQASDLVPRLRACGADVESALDALSSGPAASYLDVPYMRNVWALVQAQDTPEAYNKAVTALARGIMAGLFVNQHHGQMMLGQNLGDARHRPAEGLADMGERSRT